MKGMGGWTKIWVLTRRKRMGGWIKIWVLNQDCKDRRKGQDLGFEPGWKGWEDGSRSGF